MSKHNNNNNLAGEMRLQQLRKTGKTPDGQLTEATFQRRGAKLRRIRKVGDVATLQKKHWQAVLAAEDLLFSAEASFDDQVKAVHALVQAGAAYSKLLETTDLQAEMEALKAELQEIKQAQPLRKVG